MSHLRVRWGVVVLLVLLAVAAALLLVSLQYGLAAEYGAGSGTTVLPFALLPIALAAFAAMIVGTRRAAVAVLVFALITISATIAAAPLGQRSKDRIAAERDATFACNGPNSEFLVPEEVDEGWDDFEHPFLLYGPISQSRYGCTAGIEGPGAETWEPWRRSLLDAGWTVERDDPSQVSVSDGVLRATLHEADDLSMLTLETVIADACQQRDHRKPDPELDALC